MLYVNERDDYSRFYMLIEEMTTLDVYVLMGEVATILDGMY